MRLCCGRWTCETHRNTDNIILLEVAVILSGPFAEEQLVLGNVAIGVVGPGPAYAEEAGGLGRLEQIRHHNGVMVDLARRSGRLGSFDVALDGEGDRTPVILVALYGKNLCGHTKHPINIIC